MKVTKISDVDSQGHVRYNIGGHIVKVSRCQILKVDGEDARPSRHITIFEAFRDYALQRKICRPDDFVWAGEL